jgi:CRP/FNR family nitrogen fixation transcriptional regulator
VSAEAVGDAVVRTMKRAALTDRAERDNAFARSLWAITARELRKSQDHILTLGRRSASERVSCFLTDLADRKGAHDEIDIPMSRQDIADYLGLTIETVSRTFSQLQGSGCIAIPSCRRIVLRDADRLLDLCG